MADDRTVELLGRPFPVAEKIGLMALLKFAHIAKYGATTADIEAMDTLFQVLRAVVHPDAWDEFERHAMDTRADQEDLMRAATQAVAAATARPTVQPSDSSDGLLTTPTGSSENWSWQGASEPMSPLMSDPRVQELVPVEEAARRVSV